MEVDERIISAATNLFVTGGIKSVTMDDIAMDMGISKRTIYEKFANKKDLLRACVYYFHCKQLEEEKSYQDESSDNVLTSIFTIFANMDEHQKSKSRFFDELRRFYPDIFEEQFRTHYDYAVARLKSTLNTGIEQGVILPGTNIDFATYLVIETMYHLISHPELIPNSGVSQVDAFKYVLIYFFRGISTQKGIDTIDGLIDGNLR